jgi:hypothetical protein
MRFVAIVFPIQYKTRVSNTKMCVAAVVSWVLPVIYGILPLAGWNTWKPGCGCTIGGIWTKAYMGLMFDTFLVLLAIDVVLYTKVACIAWTITGTKRFKRDVDAHNRVKQDIKITKTMILVFFLFAVCWTPFLAMTVLWVPLKLYLQPSMMSVRRLLLTLTVSNSCLNWIVYGCRSKKFRVSFQCVLCGHKDNEMRTSRVNSTFALESARILQQLENDLCLLEMTELQT